MIDRFAGNLAVYLKKMNPDNPVSEAVQKYALILILNLTLSLLLSYIGAMILHTALPVTLILFSFAILRQFSGGYHFSSSDYCAGITAVSANVLSLIHLSTAATLVCTILALILVLAFAPSKVLTKFPTSLLPKLKWISVAIVSSNFIFMSSAVALAFLVQGLTLIRIRRSEAK